MVTFYDLEMALSRGIAYFGKSLVRGAGPAFKGTGVAEVKRTVNRPIVKRSGDTLFGVCLSSH
jgi:hypothetical protein